MSPGPLPLAVSLGDPAGIGPELIAESWARRQSAELAPFFVVGGFDVLRAAAEQRGVSCPIIAIGEVTEVNEAFTHGLPVLVGEDCDYRPAQPDEHGAALSLHSLAETTRMALLGKASGLVTAPVAKSQLAKVGFDFPGQTEFLAAACGMAPYDAVMMLAGPSLRTVPITVHVSLAEVPAALSAHLIKHKAQIVAMSLARDFGIADPHLAIAGLNPHASEDGRFGDEEVRIISPAIADLRDAGIDVSGPHPGDALFTPRSRAGYDAALCMYHDQALIPLKALEFDEGVNVTLGLPIIRTSPDHGTAFDIAGKGLADPGAMIAAIHMAASCAANRAKASTNG
ncbi:MAG: 4-hydroxythreonine-4-phosphate dehydrogenase PdxA [Pseudomonadota bacterium]